MKSASTGWRTMAPPTGEALASMPGPSAKKQRYAPGVLVSSAATGLAEGPVSYPPRRPRPQMPMQRQFPQAPMQGQMQPTRPPAHHPHMLPYRQQQAPAPSRGPTPARVVQTQQPRPYHQYAAEQQKTVEDHVVVKYAENEPAIFVGRQGLALFAKIEHVAQRGGVLNMMHALQNVVPTCLDEATALLVGTFHAVDAWARDDRLRNESVGVVRHLDAAVSKVVATSRRVPSKLPYDRAVGQLEYMAKRLDHKLVSVSQVNGGHPPDNGCYYVFFKTMRALHNIKQQRLGGAPAAAMPSTTMPLPMVPEAVPVAPPQAPHGGSKARAAPPPPPNNYFAPPPPPPPPGIPPPPQGGQGVPTALGLPSDSTTSGSSGGGKKPQAGPRRGGGKPSIAKGENGQAVPRKNAAGGKSPRGKASKGADEDPQAPPSADGRPASETPRATTASHAQLADALMGRMIDEARQWVVREGGTSNDVLKRLLWSLRLETVETTCHAMNDDVSHEDLTLTFSINERSSGKTNEDKQKAAAPAPSSQEAAPAPAPHPIERRIYEWKVDWFDFERQVADIYPALIGRFTCKPFVEDPPFFNKLQRASKRCGDLSQNHADRAKFTNHFIQAANVPRKSWNLKWLNGLKSKAESWRRAAGLKAKDLDWDDVARVICAGIGILARDEPANNGHWVFKRTMIRLEREFKTTLKGPTSKGDGDRGDPRELDESEKLRRFAGGCVNDDAYFSALKRERHWERSDPPATIQPPPTTEKHHKGKIKYQPEHIAF